MTDYKIQFEDIKWEFPRTGMREKSFTDRNKKIRLVEFNEKFVEKDWCTRGHIGYVIDGEMTIDFNGREINYKPGDILYIPQGNIYSRHKVKIDPGGKVLLFLIDDI